MQLTYMVANLDMDTRSILCRCRMYLPGISSNISGVNTERNIPVIPDTTVAGRNAVPVQVGSSSHYLQGFIYHRWLAMISSINSIIPICDLDLMNSYDMYTVYT